MTFTVHLPKFLASAGWRLELAGVRPDGMDLRPGTRRQEIRIRLREGQEFDLAAVNESARAGDIDIRIDVKAGGNLVGGMTYRLDPDLDWPFNAR
ncbi:hypothetical protein JOF56_000721 [Kibdelosporangium banguiense]|uniref:Uncharacterized protein n=1 Tax=Kibdelosporangium banguiense TaxID=1365924 RepID=A0ABS4T926_9PSEU|nr:hypothetical protein [Kibdelosporangium banguiense]MBP2320336.1 hypothetical protein [Kibdelosporangium banguiense]